MDVIVYGSTREKAYSKMDEVLSLIEHNDIRYVNKSNHTYHAIIIEKDTEDVMVLRCLVACETAKGHKWNFAYIDEDIDKFVLDDIILPNFIPFDNRFSRAEDAIIEFYCSSNPAVSRTYSHILLASLGDENTLNNIRRLDEIYQKN